MVGVAVCSCRVVKSERMTNLRNLESRLACPLPYQCKRLMHKIGDPSLRYQVFKCNAEM